MRIDKKKIILLMVFGALLIVGVIFTATYAFIEDYISPGASKNVVVEGDTVDDFKFESTGSLSLTATNNNLTNGGSNIENTLHAKAMLRANSTTNMATRSYYLFVELLNNTISVIETGYPEVILKVYDPSNTEITSITGLTYNSTYGGFDITGVTGTFMIASNRSMTSNLSNNYAVEDWTFKTVYINHNFNQMANYGRSLTAKVMMSENSI